MRLADRLALTQPSVTSHVEPSSLATALTALSRRTAHRPEIARPSASFSEDGQPGFARPSASFSEDGPPPTLYDALPGAEMCSASGHTTWVATSRHPLGSRHGVETLGRRGGCDHLERLTGDPRLHGFRPEDALFLDIEATGLEHGAGTLAFMIGLGHIDGDDVVVTQLVLREPDEERAQLELLWDLVDAFPYLVSFNGKSFDLSVLQGRLVMNRLCTAKEGELKLRPHLDLLHLSRSLYRGVFPDTRLQTLERKLLGFERIDDMPGALAPSCWFHWLREADPRPLAAIAEHNRWDVLSMVALTHVLSERSRPTGDASRPSAMWLNLARTYLRRREPSAALDVLADPPILMSAEELDQSLELEVTASRRCKETQRQARALERLVARQPHVDSWRRALARLRRPVAQSSP